MADKIRYSGEDKWKKKATELLNESGGGSLVDDVLVNGVSVVNQQKEAVIDLTPYAESSDLATVATSGNYNDLTNKPTIPAAQVQSDWTQNDTSSLDYIKHKPSLATVATSGSYTDLSNKPTIPTDTTYTIGTNGNTITLTPSSGSAQSVTAPYATNAGTVNGHTVNKDVPSSAVFTDANVLQDVADDYASGSFPLLISNVTGTSSANTGNVQKVSSIKYDAYDCTLQITDKQSHTMYYGADDIYKNSIGVWEALDTKADTDYVDTELDYKADIDGGNIRASDFLDELGIVRTPTIEEEYLTTSTAESVESGTHYTLMQLTLSKGVWQISATVFFASNSTGYRHAYIAESSSSVSAYQSMMASSNAVDGMVTALNFGRAVAITDTSKTIYLRVRHNRGSALDVFGRFTAVRLNAV